MKKIKPAIFDESLKKTYVERVDNKPLNPMAESFMKFMEGLGYEFVDVKVQPGYKKGKIRTMKVKS